MTTPRDTGEPRTEAGRALLDVIHLDPRILPAILAIEAEAASRAVLEAVVHIPREAAAHGAAGEGPGLRAALQAVHEDGASFVLAHMVRDDIKAGEIRTLLERIVRAALAAHPQVGPSDQVWLDGIRDEVREAVQEGDAQDCSSPECIADAVYEIVRVRLRDLGPPQVGPETEALVLVRRDSGGVFPDGTTNHPYTVTTEYDATEAEAKRRRWSPTTPEPEA